MRKAELTCYRCDGNGHIAAECTNAGIDSSNGRPPWCGICDETTRLVDLGDKAGRCTVCHPLARQQLKQFRKCPRCHVTVYEHDHNPCGRHIGPEVPDKRPDREHIDAVMATVK